MDRLAQYRLVIKRAIRESNYYRYPPTATESLFACDDETSLYILYNIGWRGDDHISRIWLIVRLREEKIWIDEDWTEEGIATELIRLGVPPSEIVLAFVPPNQREEIEPLPVLQKA